MNFTKTKIATALAFSLVASGAHAIPTIMAVTAGTFALSHHTDGGIWWDAPFIISVGTGATDITDQYNAAGWNIFIAQPGDVIAPGAIASWNMMGAQLNTFTAPSAGGISGGPAPVFNGKLENGNVSSIDMTSFFMSWNGESNNQGDASQTSNGNNPLVTNLTLSNCVAGTCDWSMSWISKNVAFGIFAPHQGTWALSGTIAAVPEVSTYGMMLAGLGLVGFVARRRRRKTEI